MLFVIRLRKFPFRHITKVQIAAAAESLETHVEGLFKMKILTWETEGKLLLVPPCGAYILGKPSRSGLAGETPENPPPDFTPPIERLPI